MDERNAICGVWGVVVSSPGRAMTDRNLPHFRLGLIRAAFVPMPAMRMQIPTWFI